MVTRFDWTTGGVRHEALRADWLDMPEIWSGSHLPNQSESRRKLLASAKKMERNPEWYGGLTNISQVTDMIRNGWPEGLDRVAPVLEDLKVDISSGVQGIKPYWKSDEWGSQHRWEKELEGDADMAWRRRVRRKTTGNTIVKLGSAFGGHANVCQSEYFWCGAQMALAVEILERAGFQVEASAYVLSKFGPNGHVFEVCGKRAGDALNLSGLMALMGHIGIYRTLGFAGFASAGTNHALDFGRDVTVGAAQMLEDYYAAGGLDRYDVMLPLCYRLEDCITNVKAAVGKVGELAGVTLFKGAAYAGEGAA